MGGDVLTATGRNHLPDVCKFHKDCLTNYGYSDCVACGRPLECMEGKALTIGPDNSIWSIAGLGKMFNLLFFILTQLLMQNR